jgi:hypothetical protein
VVQVAVFPLTVLFVRVRVLRKSLKRPPPTAPHWPLPLVVQLTVFPLTVLFVRVRVLPKLMKRPPPWAEAEGKSPPLLVALTAPPVIVTPEIVAGTPENVMTLVFAPVASMIVLPAPAPLRFRLIIRGKVSPRARL